ncbi:hypothetical protein K8S19_02995 [bacterium]|nr:hypothetical protein [bacterium]
MGPSAPEALTQQTLQNQALTETDAVEVVPELGEDVSEDQCRGKKWSKYKYRHYLRKFHYGFVRWMSVKIVKNWFADPNLTRAYKKMTRTRLFYIVTFRCGVGPMLFLESLKIVAETWYPGVGTNPKNCNPEITLMPYQWNLWRGFYGDRQLGWGNGNGYHIESLTEDLDNVILQTSGVGEGGQNLFMNEAPIIDFTWHYFYYPQVPTGTNVPKQIRVRMMNEHWNHKFRIHDNSYIEINNERIKVDDVWFSTLDKSAVCKVISEGLDLLDMDLSFDATGAGGGTVDVKNWRGRINHYVFVVYSNGHGYYTKNGGRRRRF